MDKIVYELDDEEMILADGGYNDDYEFFETPTGINDDDQRMKTVSYTHLTLPTICSV